MERYRVRITGKTPLLMHNDNIGWADDMSEWNADPKNKKQSVAGDDRSPSWRWLGHCYHDGKYLSIPQENIMKAIGEAAAMVPVPGSKTKKTFKAQSQSGMATVEMDWNLRTAAGELVPWAEVLALKDEKSFTDHLVRVRALGFSLFVKRAKVGTSKHVRVRPKFDAGWTVEGTIVVEDEQITQKALQQMLDLAGEYKGLCDWRPGSPKSPGPWGKFEAVVEKC